VIHGTLLVTDHVHSRPAATVNLPLPPDDPIDGVEFDTVMAHLSSDGPVVVFDDVPQADASSVRQKMKLGKTFFIGVNTFSTFVTCIATLHRMHPVRLQTRRQQSAARIVSAACYDDEAVRRRS
jgi:hypothetical protein